MTTERAAVSKKTTDCPASLDIKIKLVTKMTKFQDFYLRRDPPLCAVITVHLNHNHSVTAADVIGLELNQYKSNQRF